MTSYTVPYVLDRQPCCLGTTSAAVPRGLLTGQCCAARLGWLKFMHIIPAMGLLWEELQAESLSMLRQGADQVRV